MTGPQTPDAPGSDNSDDETSEIPTSSGGGRRGLLSRFGGDRRTLWVNGGLAVLLVVAVVLAFSIIGNPSTPPAPVRTAVATRGDVTATVTGTGNTVSQLAIPVSFQTDDTVLTVNVKAGDTVTVGQVLATVDPRASQESLRSAQAGLDNARAALGVLVNGPTDIRKQQDQQAIKEAQQNLGNARQVRSNDDDSTDTDVKTAQVQLDADTKAQNTLVDNAEDDVRAACDGVALRAFTSSSDGSGSTTSTTSRTPAPVTTSAPTPSASPTTPNLGSLSSGLLSSANAANGGTGTATSQDSCTSARQDLRQAQNTRDATLRKDRLAVTSAEQQQDATLQNAGNGVTVAQGQVRDSQLAAQNDLNPNTKDQIAQGRANVDSAQVTVDTAQRNLDGTVLKAPIAGVVLEVDGKVGQNSGNVAGGSNNNGSGSSNNSVAASGGASSANASTASAGSTSGQGFLSIANPSQLKVVADVAEADAANLQIGQKATVTFPATNNSATGTVTEIQPQSTVTNNVVLFPVEVSLDTAPDGVKTGSTANLDITKQTVSGVLQVPSAAVTTTGTSHTVTVQRDGNTAVVPVQIGVTGATNTEITSGLTEGDVVVLPTPSTNTSPTGGFPRLGGGR